MRYPVVLRETDEGYSVQCPALSGCWSQGKTEAEALANIADAIQDYLAALHDSLAGADVREVEISA
ncbi:MAG: type II toxin-antitoxin system HicB family antitoxin [Verrucomicrobia bacterium]|nr:type II toxin-antitoxin system HicB family antitoxin [Verrucomicrobiota bacterium]MBV9657044.1 type II toxin-antitoxin system HicB family antitoxin [Verrucomicrobiota bacterium]